MAAPTKSKTWQYNVNNSCYSSAQTELQHHQLIMFRYKECLKSFASYAWTVSGSSDSSTSGMDASDRWVASTNLIWASSGAHSWIVIRQPQISALFEVCIDLLNAGGGGARQATIVISPSVGFGVAHGGTDGSTTARPTATDEHVILTTAAWCDNLNSAPYYQTFVHAMESNDGQCTRIYACQNNKVVGMALFDVPKNPISAWSPACVYAWACSGTSTTNVMTYVKFNDATNVFFKHSGTDASFYLAATGYVTQCAGERILVPNALNNMWNDDPVVLCSATATRRGQWGELFDIYWGCSSTTPLNGFEDSGYNQWVSIGEMITPWNGTLMRAG